MRKSVSLIAALAIALPTVVATSAPAAAHGHRHGGYYDQGYNNNDNYNGYNSYNAGYNRGPSEWRGDDGRTYCRKSDGTVGLIIGGAGGALIGRGLDRGYNRATGTILGAAAGALLGREVAKKRRCR